MTSVCMSSIKVCQMHAIKLLFRPLVLRRLLFVDKINMMLILIPIFKSNANFHKVYGTINYVDIILDSNG